MDERFLAGWPTLRVGFSDLCTYRDIGRLATHYQNNTNQDEWQNHQGVLPYETWSYCPTKLLPNLFHQVLVHRAGGLLAGAGRQNNGRPAGDDIAARINTFA